jgi:hypothetical protein
LFALVDGHHKKCRKEVHICFAGPISEGAQPDPISKVQPAFAFAL